MTGTFLKNRKMLLLVSRRFIVLSSLEIHLGSGMQRRPRRSTEASSGRMVFPLAWDASPRLKSIEFTVKPKYRCDQGLSRLMKCANVAKMFRRLGQTWMRLRCRWRSI